MTAATFSSTAVPLTAPLIAAPHGGIDAVLRPFILIGVVAFMVGFMGFMILGRPHAAVAQGRYEAPAAVSIPASSPAPDAPNAPTPV